MTKQSEISSQQRKLYVDNVPIDTLKDELRLVFEAYGQVEDVTLMHKSKNKPMAFAFVVMRNE